MSEGLLSKLRGTTGLGFGGAPLGNLYTALDEATAAQALDAAWQVGLRYFDTAPLYGQGLSEERMGRALAGKPRGEYFISTKVGRVLVPSQAPLAEQDGYVAGLPFSARFDYSGEGAQRSLEDSLRRMGLDRIDVVYIHDIDRATHGGQQPQRFAEAMDGAYPALARLRSEGVIGAIGLGVNEWEVCEQALAHADFDCFMLAGRYTLLDQSARESLLPKCREKGVRLVLGGVYNSGILATGAVAGARYDYQPAGPAVLARTRELESACRWHGVPLRAAALQFALACPEAAAVVVGARSPHEVSDAAAMARWPIPGALWEELQLRGLLGAAPAALAAS
jgi:D-threo-aldose 1-dehydrogenase